MLEPVILPALSFLDRLTGDEQRELAGAIQNATAYYAARLQGRSIAHVAALALEIAQLRNQVPGAFR